VSALHAAESAERLRVLLREELGVSPGRAVQDTYTQLLG
jgi:hypothetical protein